MCCGSGCIGLSIAKHTKNSFVTLSDVSFKALNATRKNAKILGLKKNIEIIKSNLFNNLKETEKFDIILSNPPYIKSDDIKLLNKSVKNFDPLIALDGGKDGLKFYKQICAQSKNFLNKTGIVIVEIGYNQKNEVEALFKNNNFTTKCLKDYSKNDRVIIATKKEN